MYMPFAGLRPLRVSCLLAALPVAQAQPAIQPTVDITKVPAAAQPSAHFDANAATEAYMAMIPPAATARSNAYFEGGYWLILWDFLYSLGHFAAAAQHCAGRHACATWPNASRASKWLQTFIYWVEYTIADRLCWDFPLEFYENFVREHKYGLATQTFGPWMGDEGKGLLIVLILGGLAVVLLFRHCAQAVPHLVDLGSGCQPWLLR